MRLDNSTTRDTLRYVNKIRKQLGFKPLKDLKKGFPSSSGSCPIARSLPYSVEISDEGVFVSRPGDDEIAFYDYEPPRAVKQFISAFDVCKEGTVRWVYATNMFTTDEGNEYKAYLANV